MCNFCLLFLNECELPTSHIEGLQSWFYVLAEIYAFTVLVKKSFYVFGDKTWFCGFGGKTWYAILGPGRCSTLARNMLLLFWRKKKTFFTVWKENMILWFWRKNMISKFRWENIIFIFWFKFFNFFSTSEPLIFRSSRRSCPNRLRPSNFGFSGFSIVRQFSFGSNIVRQFGKYVRVIKFFVCYKPCDC